jgi:hypothetical protein
MFMHHGLGRTLRVLLVASMLPDAVGGQSGTAVPRIVVDPDVRVTYDGGAVHMEAYITGSSSNPNLLLVGGEVIAPGRAWLATETRIWRSTDAGARWSPILLPTEVNGGWDNAITAGPGSVAYFLTSSSQRVLTIHRSYDDGATWAPTSLGINPDRPQIVVDRSAGTNQGRVYVAAELDGRVVVASSADSGRTFGKPVTACLPPERMSVATTDSPVVLSDGTLVVPCSPYPDYPTRLNWRGGEVGVVLSTDGGRSFGAFHSVGRVERAQPREYYAARARGDVLRSGNIFPGPAVTVAPPGSPHADRLYAVWQNVDSTGRSRIVFTYSGDRGATWRAPLPVAPAPAPVGRPAWSRQGVPMVAVNQDGVVGIAWLDSRLAPGGSGYDVYFTASVDGGRSFLPAARVSSATSFPARGESVAPLPLERQRAPSGEQVIAVTSPYNTRSSGGDYSTMAVDAAGRFHPLWSDARDGGWQLYSATVRVLEDPASRDLAASARTGSCTIDSSRVQFVYGAPEWDSGAHEAVLPVRLFNASADTLTRAIRVTVTPGLPTWSSRAANAAEFIPRIWDAARNAYGDSATFVFAPGPHTALFPSGVTGLQRWRFHVLRPELTDFTLRAWVRLDCGPG